MADELGSLEVWDGVADAWVRHRERLFAASRPVSERLVAAAVAESRSVLEINAGTGETSFLAAARVGPSGRVVCTDFAPRMVAAAESEARARGLENVECRVMDALSLDLPDRSVDGIVSRYGLMLMPDPARALGEARRVLRPGGTLAYAVWGPPDRNLWIVLLGAAAIQHGVTPPGDPFGPGGLFSLSAPERNREILTAAGFSTIEIEDLAFPFRFESFDEYLRIQTDVAGPLAAALAALPDAHRAQIRHALAAATEGFRTAGGAMEFPSSTTVAVAS